MKKIHLLVCFITISIFISAQNVGVGTTTPLEKLHVAGNIKADTIKPDAIKLMPNAGAGKLLTSDDEGNASWQSMIASGNNNGNVGFGVWGDCATNGNISGYNPVADEEGLSPDQFGNSVSVSGNFAIVGAYADDGPGGIDQGSASFYQFDGTNWIFMEKITDPDGLVSANFGQSVSISGNYAVVGAPGYGSASIYQFDGVSWVLMEKISGAPGQFGYSVSISGNYIIVGALYENGIAGFRQGSASIYQFDGSNWVLMEKLFDATGDYEDLFGCNVSISGNYAIVGALRDNVNYVDQGSASIYQFDGSNWVLMQKLSDPTISNQFGNSVSISGNYAIVGSFSAAANIYQYNGSNWILMQKLTDATTGVEYFGSSVSISGNYVIAGAYGTNVGANADQGSARIFQRLGNSWQRLQYITDPRGNLLDLFGQATAIDDVTKNFLIGVPGYASQMGKAVFGKVN